MKQIIQTIEVTKTKRTKGRLNFDSKSFETEEPSSGFGESTSESDEFINSIILKSTMGGNVET